MQKERKNNAHAGAITYHIWTCNHNKVAILGCILKRKCDKLSKKKWNLKRKKREREMIQERKIHLQFQLYTLRKENMTYNYDVKLYCDNPHFYRHYNNNSRMCLITILHVRLSTFYQKYNRVAN